MFNIFKRNSVSIKQGLELNFSKDFVDQNCRCVQQDLDLSELIWMDTSAHHNVKEKLKEKSEMIKSEYLISNRQRDLFK